MRRLSRPVLVAHCSLGANSPISPPQRIIYFVIRNSYLVTVSSPLQFANGSKGFLIPSTPDLFVYATGGASENDMGEEALKETFTVEGADPPTFEDGAESVFTTQGHMRFPGIRTILCSVYYAVNGGPGGKGYMLIHPNDPLLAQNNSDAGTALINFLGALTPDQAGVQGGTVVNAEGSQYAIQSIAATTLRITYDFAAGTSTTEAIMQLIKTEGENPEPTVVLRIGPKAFFARPA